MGRRGTLFTFYFSHFCYGGHFTTRFGFLLLDTEQLRATIGSLIRVLNSSKLTGKATGLSETHSHTQSDHLHAWIFTFSCGVLFAGMTKYCWMGSFSTWVTWYFLGLLTCPYGEQMVYFLQFFFIWGLLNSYTTGYTEHCIIIIFTHAIILITIPRLSQSPSPVWIDHLLFDPLLINHYLH